MWFAALVSVAAVVELVSFLVQLRPTMKAEDWTRAKQLVQRTVTSDDLVVFAPSWIEPLGREHFGADLMTIRRSAFADTSRFRNIVEVGWHGHRHWATQGFARSARAAAVGPFTIRWWRNPAFEPVVDDLLDHVSKGRLTVERVTGTRAVRCNYRAGQPLTGPLGFGPAAPSERFFCARGSWVGVTVLADTNYRARRCLYAPPLGGGSRLRLTFHSVRFGGKLVMHHGLYVEAERDGTGSPVEITISAGDQKLGGAIHRDGEGWSEVTMSTKGLRGQTGDLTAEISSRTGNRRMYCFEATTR